MKIILVIIRYIPHPLMIVYLSVVMREGGGGWWSKCIPSLISKMSVHSQPNQSHLSPHWRASTLFMVCSEWWYYMYRYYHVCIPTLVLFNRLSHCFLGYHCMHTSMSYRISRMYLKSRTQKLNTITVYLIVWVPGYVVMLSPLTRDPAALNTSSTLVHLWSLAIKVTFWLRIIRNNTTERVTTTWVLTWLP